MAKEKEDYPLILTAADVAEIMRISQRHAYELMEVSGTLVKVPGRTKRVPREAFFKWLLQESSA